MFEDLLQEAGVGAVEERLFRRPVHVQHLKQDAKDHRHNRQSVHLARVTPLVVKADLN